MPFVLRSPVFALTLLLALTAPLAAATQTRLLTIDDFDRTRDVTHLACAPDGEWMAYTVESTDRDADERQTTLRMVSRDGRQDLPLTPPARAATSAQFSPDGRYLSFLAKSPRNGRLQIHLLDRQGGEARQLTEVGGDIGGYSWSPDGRRIVLSMSPATESPPGPQPIVIDRLHFKQDRDGYLRAADRQQLYLLEVDKGTLTPLTTEQRYDDTRPTWSPDGAWIAFLSGRLADPDGSGQQEVYVIAPHAGATARLLARNSAPDRESLAWSADGRRVIYAVGLEPRLQIYSQDQLAAAPVAGGEPVVFTRALDRKVGSPVVLADTGTVATIAEDDAHGRLLAFALGGGSPQPLLKDGQDVLEVCSGGGHLAVIAADDHHAPEVHALEQGQLRQLTHQNDALFASLTLGAVEDVAFPSRDGTSIHGLLVKPPGYRAGVRYPTLLWIHGGPNGQDSHALVVGEFASALERQWFAAHGYVVLAVNYRGSSGRGEAFATAIAADWGHLEVEDLLAGVDHLVRLGVSDPDRLGIGGWSYGGILTDYTIASDARFKAAISGAGSANQTAMYGIDQYISQYNAELQPPWVAPDRWMHLSYPFFHADRIRTPTFFLGGTEDFDVPLAGGEQMYQALRTLGVPTQLVVYPGQFHGFSRPSFIRDRMIRDLAWFDRFLSPDPRSGAPDR